MFALFLDSVALHLEWFFKSFTPAGRACAPLGIKRLIFLFIAYPLFLGLQLVHWGCFLLDELLFASYRKVNIEQPLFISGIPRSGTTFVHRSLDQDPNFTSFSSWEAVLAPSITQRKVIRALAALDRCLGAPCKHLVAAITQKATGDFNAIHEVGPEAAEEDYLALLPAGACFILSLAFPASPALKQLGAMDEMPPLRRGRLLDFYKRLIQKHLYCAPAGTRLLSKNAAFSSWVPALQELFHDARFILCVREPNTALSSQLSSLRPARGLFATDPQGTHTTQNFTRLYIHNYRLLASICQSADPAQIALIEQSDLKQDSAAILRACLQQLKVQPSPELEATFQKMEPRPQSQHTHKQDDFPFEKEQIEVCIRPSYEQLLAADIRVPLNRPN